MHVSKAAPKSGLPALCAKAGDVQAVWTGATQDGTHLFLGRYSGGTWSPLLQVTKETGESAGPAITFDSHGRAHVAWMDEIAGTGDIYHRLVPSE